MHRCLHIEESGLERRSRFQKERVQIIDITARCSGVQVHSDGFTMSYLFLLALLSLLSLAFSIALSRAQSIYDCQAKLCYSRSDFPMGCGASALPGPSAGTGLTGPIAPT